MRVLKKILKRLGYRKKVSFSDISSFGQTDEMAGMKWYIWSGVMSESNMILNIDSMNLFNRELKNILMIYLKKL